MNAIRSRRGERDMETILVRTKNSAATEFYYDIIADALHQCSELIFDGFDENAIPKGHKNAVVVAGSCVSMMRLWMKGYRNIVTWYQGVLPEESFIRNRSRARMLVLGFIEKFALRHSALQIFVSDAMREFYEEKYGLELTNCYTMPCFNTQYNAQLVAGKCFDGRVFTYTGGLSKWQCIDQTLALYKRIEEASGNTTKLLLLTPALDKARELVTQYGICNAEIKSVHYSQLPEALKEASFGFALREDNPVNRVATPTKFANYVANGVIPVYTSCVRDFLKASEGNPYQIVLQDVNAITDEDVRRIMEMADNMPDAREVSPYFGAYFEAYYNPHRHARQLAHMIGKIDTL